MSGEIIRHEFVAYKNDSNSDYYELLLKLDKEGHYVGCVKYNGCRLGPPHFTILSLSGTLCTLYHINNLYYTNTQCMLKIVLMNVTILVLCVSSYQVIYVLTSCFHQHICYGP